MARLRPHLTPGDAALRLERHGYNEPMSGSDHVKPAIPETPAGLKLTYDDFVLFPDDGKRHELIDGEHYVTPSPHLKVKVGSPSTRRRDEKLKHQLYERFGVSEYWVVDPDIDVVRVFRLVDGKYLRADESSRDHGDVLTTPLVPGLDLPLSDLFAE